MTNIIYVCHNYSKCRFIEYMQSVKDFLNISKELYYSDHPTINGLKFNTDNFIVAQRIPFEDSRFSPNNTSIINTEQLTRNEWKTRICGYIDRGFKVYSYSLSDIVLEPRLIYLPYGHNSKENDKLINYMKVGIKYDVAFCGHMNNRRRNVLRKLQAKGLRVLELSDSWGDDRDKQIAQSKLLLNIHYLEDYQIYESIRCDRWLRVGMPVVSESCIPPVNDHSLLYWADYDSLVDKVIGVILILS